MEFLKEYGAYIVGIPSVILTIVVAYWIYKKQTKVKSLTYIIESYYDLVSEKIKESNLKIFFEEVQVKNVAILILEIRNNGNVPIAPNDFIKDFKVSFSDKTKILT